LFETVILSIYGRKSATHNMRDINDLAVYVMQSEGKNLALCIFKKIRRARSFAALRMTTVEPFSAACKAPPFPALLIDPPSRAPCSPAVAGLHGARDEQKVGSRFAAGLKPRPSGRLT